MSDFHVSAFALEVVDRYIEKLCATGLQGKAIAETERIFAIFERAGSDKDYKIVNSIVYPSASEFWDMLRYHEVINETDEGISIERQTVLRLTLYLPEKRQIGGDYFRVRNLPATTIDAIEERIEKDDGLRLQDVVKIEELKFNPLLERLKRDNGDMLIYYDLDPQPWKKAKSQIKRTSKRKRMRT